MIEIDYDYNNLRKETRETNKRTSKKKKEKKVQISVINRV